MVDFVIEAEHRSAFGKAETRRLRRLDDKVPGVVYGAKKDPAHFQISQKDLRKMISNEAFFSHIIELKLQGNSESVIIKHLEKHPFKSQLMHLDLQRIVSDEKLEIDVPIHFLNRETCIGVKSQGGALYTDLNEINVSCLPRDLPEFIEIDVANLEVGHVIHLSEITLPSGVAITALELDEEHDQVVVRVTKIVENIELDEDDEADLEVDATDDKTDDESDDDSK